MKTSGSDPLTWQTDIRILHDEVRMLRHRTNLLLRIVAGLVVAVVMMLFAVVLLYAQRSAARAYYNGRIHSLICEIPPGRPFSDKLRAQERCPRPTQAPRGTASHTPIP